MSQLNGEKKKLTHGGDWAGFEMEYGRAPLDFSMNVNPLGIPATVQAAIAEAGRSAARYPDPLCRRLTRKLAGCENVPPEWIFCGNGAADIIFRLAQALKPDEAAAGRRPARRPALLITAPTFSEYETAFTEYGWDIRRYVLKEENGFRIGAGRVIDEADPAPQADPASEEDSGAGDLLQMIDEDVDAVFLCEPNNPTGVTTDRLLLQKILEKCRRAGAMLIIDECFNGFLEEPAKHTMLPLLRNRAGLGNGACRACRDADPDRRAKAGSAPGGLIILRAFTKLYGMAGVRLGYCICADEAVTAKIRAAGPPWNVSGLAQAAGIAALKAEEHVAEGLRIVRQERPWLKVQLRKLGIHRVYGEANYLLFYWDAVPDLDIRLRERGILIRDCSNYPGLGEGWYRIAVRIHEENEQLIEALRKELK